MVKPEELTENQTEDGKTKVGSRPLKPFTTHLPSSHRFCCTMGYWRSSQDVFPADVDYCCTTPPFCDGGGGVYRCGVCEEVPTPPYFDGFSSLNVSPPPPPCRPPWNVCAPILPCYSCVVCPLGFLFGWLPLCLCMECSRYWCVTTTPPWDHLLDRCCLLGPCWYHSAKDCSYVWRGLYCKT